LHAGVNDCVAAEVCDDHGALNWQSGGQCDRANGLAGHGRVIKGIDVLSSWFLPGKDAVDQLFGKQQVLSDPIAEGLQISVRVVAVRDPVEGVVIDSERDG